MNRGRMPACNVHSFAGTDIASVPYVHIGQNHTDTAEKKQYSSEKIFSPIGNRCGHNKNQFKMSAVFRKGKFNNKRPLVLQKCGERLLYLSRNIRRPFSNKSDRGGKYQKSGIFDWCKLLFENDEFRRLLYHFDRDTRLRRRRSESIEATIFLVLLTIVDAINLREMACGFYDRTNIFRYFNYAYLIKKSGSSLSRFQRAIKILKDQNYITVENIYKTLDDGAIITTETRIHVTEKVFELFGVTEQFLKDREYALGKFNKKQKILETRQSYLELFRPRDKFKKKKKWPEKRQDILQCAIMIKRVPPSHKGNGEKIKEAISNYIAQGLSISDAMKLVRQQYPPS